MIPILSALLFASVSNGSIALPAGDGPEWGGFRGNNGAGVSNAETLPAALSPETTLWRTELPGGYSSPIVAGEHIFVTGAEGEKLFTISIGRRSGKERWRREIEFDGKRPGANSPAAPTPATDGERVFALFHSVGLVAYDLEGEEVWRKEMGPFNIPHGMATSPLVHGDTLIQVVDQDTDSYIAAFDTATGEEKWRADRPGFTHGYSTPAVYAPAEGPAQVIVSGSLEVCAYSLADGKKLWWVEGSAWQTKAVPLIDGDTCIVNAYMVPSSEFGMPKLSQTWEEILGEKDANENGKIDRSEWDHAMMQQVWFIFDLDGDDMLDERDYGYAQSAGHATGGLFAIGLDGEGDVTESHLKWQFPERRGLPDSPSPVLYDGTVFMIKEGGVFTAVDPTTGEVSKRGRVGESDRYFASPVAADGKVYTASQSGQLAVVAAQREWEVVSVHSLEEAVWSTPAIAGDQVFVRSQNALYCFQGGADE